MVLRELLMPRQWKPPEDRKFVLDAEQINELCETAERILREEPSVLRLTGALPAPANVILRSEQFTDAKQTLIHCNRHLS